MTQGAQVAIFDIAESPSEHLPESPAIKYFKCNVASSESVDSTVKAAAEAFGHIDILVNCAGVMDGFERPGDTSNEMWDKLMSINLNGPFYMTRAVMPYFMKNDPKPEPGALPVYDMQGNQHQAPPPSKGVIVNICSVAALGGGSAGTAYTTSKHALLGLSRSTAWMYRNDGVRCNVVFPGGVATNIYANSAVQINPEGMAAVKPYHNTAPSLVMGAGSIASAVLWLAIPSNMNVNGTEVVVDGGWTSA